MQVYTATCWSDTSFCAAPLPFLPAQLAEDPFGKMGRRAPPNIVTPTWVRVAKSGPRFVACTATVGMNDGYSQFVGIDGYTRPRRGGAPETRTQTERERRRSSPVCGKST